MITLKFAKTLWLQHGGLEKDGVLDGGDGDGEKWGNIKAKINRPCHGLDICIWRMSGLMSGFQLLYGSASHLYLQYISKESQKYQMLLMG